MGNFLVSWFINHNKFDPTSESRRFFDVPEDFVDGFIEGLKAAGYLKVIKQRL